MRKFVCLGLGVIAASNCSAAALEDSVSKKIHFDVTVYNGYITGNSEEVVYRPSRAIGYDEFVAGTSDELVVISDSKDLASYLDWKLRNLLVNGVKSSARIGKWHLLMNGWYRLHASQTIMIDRDWFEPAQMTHISWSPAKLKNAYEVCAEVGYDLYQWLFPKHDLSLQALGGYKYLNLYWEASGGIYHYYDEWGTFPDRLGIGYGQKFAVPYLGLRIDSRWKELSCGLFWKMSPGLSSIASHDYHALRATDFYVNFENGDYWMVGGNFGWNFRSKLALNLSYTFDQLRTTRGNTYINDHEKGKFTYFSGGAGICHAHQICTIDATVPF